MNFQVANFLFFKYLFILAAPNLSYGTRDLCCGMWTLSCSMHAGSSSPTRYRTRVPCIGSTESCPLDHQGSPQLRTFKDVNVHSHVQSHKLVHVSGVHCHVHASSTSGCAFVYFTVQYCIEYSSTISLFQAQDVWKEA